LPEIVSAKYVRPAFALPWSNRDRCVEGRIGVRREKGGRDRREGIGRGGGDEIEEGER
jgi:hypothetical protein